MATVDGNTPLSMLYMDDSDNSSNLLTPGPLDFVTRGYDASPTLSTGSTTFNEPIDVTPALPAPQDGYPVTGHGDYWFERIHIFPPAKDYNFILSSQHIFMEVYNAYRETTQTVVNIVEGGPSGVDILTPYVLPLVFPPLHSRTFDVLVSVVGPPRANNTIFFDFDDEDVGEPVPLITGLRLLPFTIPLDWNSGIDDRIAYMTDVMTAYDQTEQRVMLRSVPNRSLAYRAAGLDPRESGLLHSLLWNWQSRSYGVLLWMDAAPLQADVAAGTSDLLVDTSEMSVAVGDTVIVISDAFFWFAAPILEITGGSIKLETPLDRDFIAGGKTLVIPVILGRVAEEVPMDRPTNDSTIVPVKFDLQVVVI